jgi:hypothetical protein
MYFNCFSKLFALIPAIVGVFAPDEYKIKFVNALKAFDSLTQVFDSATSLLSM